MNYHFEMIAQNITKIVTLLMCYGKKLMEILMKNDKNQKEATIKKYQIIIVQLSYKFNI